MRPLLLLIDLQNDFLGAPGLEPAAGEIVERAARLLRAARDQGLPVVHVMTTVDRARDERMPHWKAVGRWTCVRGTPGHESPVALRRTPSEPVVHKTDFSAFSTGELDRIVAGARADTMVVAGVLLHGCVRATVLDAYARRLNIWVAEDAVGSDDPLHAAITARYLESRAARFAPVEALVLLLAKATPGVVDPAPVLRMPAAVIRGQEIHPGGLSEIVHRSPRRREERLFAVPIAGDSEAALAVGAAQEALGRWASVPPSQRAGALRKVADRLEADAERLAQQMAGDVGKPLALGRVEVLRAAALFRAVERFADVDSSGGSAARVLRRPLGVVAAVTPWNNPVAIPCGKIGPALFWGNAVVWKPAPAATRTALTLLALLSEAGVPEGLVSLVVGGRTTASAVMKAAGVEGVSISGSSRAGWTAQEICASRRIPLQAELGGNNGSIVWDGADVPRAATRVARGAFSFGGQRCTANRRAIVDERLYDRFLQALVAEVAALRCGDPLEPETEIGPLVSDEACARIGALLSRLETGARVLAPHAEASEFVALRRLGSYYPPTIVLQAGPESEIVTEEAFGPVLVVQRARDFDTALLLNDQVRQGLVASLFGGSAGERRRFLEETRAGVLKLDESTADADASAPFGGWKVSGIGPPEHGESAREFFTRAQAVYGTA